MTKVCNFLVESSSEIEVLTEQTDQGKQLYIEGIFAQSEKKNGNGRMYERAIMEGAVNKYNEQYVSKNRALGELNHPERPFADPAEAAIRITEMTMKGNDVHGKALVLNTPKGQIIKGLLEGGFSLGVSTRGLGSLKEKNGMKYVQSDFMMTAVDAVDNPSAPDAYVNGIMESTKWALNESTGMWTPMMNEDESEEVNEQLFLEKFEQILKGAKEMKSFKEYLTEISMPNFRVKVASSDKDKASFVASKDYRESGGRYTKDGNRFFVVGSKKALSKLVYHFQMQNITIEKIEHTDRGKYIGTIDPKDV